MILSKENQDVQKRGPQTWRKRRRVRKSAADDLRPLDLPVFLISPNQDSNLPLEYLEADADPVELQASSLPYASGKVQSTYTAAKNYLSSIQQHTRSRLDKLADKKRRDEIARLGLAALLIPILILLMPARLQPISEKTPTSQPAQPHPDFNLENRLSFAEPLRNKLLAQAITSSLKEEPPQKKTDAGPMLEGMAEPRETEALAAAAAVKLDDQESWDQVNWRYPFDSTNYVPIRLPATAAESFRAEAQLTILNDQNNKIAEVDAAPAKPAPIKKHAIQKYKRAIAQKRRSQPASQMTASASPPPAVPQQPNLPPPPILFFLGAPPPTNANSP